MKNILLALLVLVICETVNTSPVAVIKVYKGNGGYVVQKSN